MNDLWPDDLITDVSLLIPPGDILEEQARHLQRHARGLVQGEVTSSPTVEGVELEFCLAGQDGYRQTLFVLTHAALPFPCRVWSEEGTESQANEFSHDWMDVRGFEKFDEASNPEELIGIVGKILGAASTRGVVLGMAVRARQAGHPPAA